MCGFEKHGVTQGPSKALVGKMTQGGLFIFWNVPQICKTLHCVACSLLYNSVQSSKMVTLLLPIFLESLPGYNVALCLNIAIKNKVSNDEIFTILKDVPNPNQDNDGKPV